MTHNEKRSQWYREGAIGLGVGVLYGTTSVLVGHPFDTIKTKMQAQKGFESTRMVKTLVRTLKTQQLAGLYRGFIPPLWGSGIYRSVQFAVFEAAYTYGDNEYGRYEIPGSGGLQLRVVIAGLLGSSSRAFIESPLEYAKIQGQTNQKWAFRKVFTGFGITWVRCLGLMTTYFILVDSGRRHYPEAFRRPVLGPFLTSGIAATLAWWIVWPLEYMKSQVQSDYGSKMSVIARMRMTIKQRGGYFALYRGILPGTIRSFMSNGTSMIVMAFAHRKVSEWGLRGKSLEVETIEVEIKA